MNQSRINKESTTPPQVKALWLSDLHLEKTNSTTLPLILEKIQNTSSDIVIITGDISTPAGISDHLSAISQACLPRNVYFVTGNHDYYGGGSLADVDAEIKTICSHLPNLQFLNGDEVIKLSNNTALVGVRGWADAKAGRALRTVIESPDMGRIKDFAGLSHQQVLHKMRDLGMQSADVIRQIIPLALCQYKNLIIMTHFPPFYQSVRFNGEVCSQLHQPHYVNQSMGLTIWGIAKEFLDRNITVLAGHTHSPAFAQISSNVRIQVADARPGRLAFKLLDL